MMPPARALLRRHVRWLLPLTMTLLGVAAGLVFSSVQPRTYTSEAVLYFSAHGGVSTSDHNSASQLVRNQVLSFAQLARSRSVLDEVAGETGVEEPVSDLAERITATVPMDTVVLQIAATGATAEESAELANAVAAHVASQASRLSPTGSDAAPVIRGELVTRATPPQEPSAPSKRVFAGVGGFAGLLLGAAAAAAMIPPTNSAQRATETEA